MPEKVTLVSTMIDLYLAFVYVDYACLFIFSILLIYSYTVPVCLVFLCWFKGFQRFLKKLNFRPPLRANIAFMLYFNA